MRVSYHGYRVVDENGEWIVDLRPFVSWLASLQDIDFKAQFTYNGEGVVLLPLQGNVYLFLQARDNEVIKRLQKRTLSATDISSVLGNDSVAFASYVLMGDCWFGLASTVLAPRVTAFAHHLQEVLVALRKNVQFGVTPLTEKIEKNQITSLDRVSAISLTLTAESTLFDQVVGCLFADGASADYNLGALEIRMSPPRAGKVDNKAFLKQLADALPNKGLASLEARAKREAIDRMTDVYVVGSGGIADDLSIDDESKLAAAMMTRADSNERLAAKLKEFRENAKFQTARSPRDLGLDRASASRALGLLPKDGGGA